ncbi:GGDEF domain-containing protein [Dactylosporangium vinaceum]|uniref:Diguanylate cyclase n=1 Tax=Dactylosporangium vinaceum TaxID=53362 RepID=A0ABV5MAI2_9ACTN|nr:tetratricopeptide repeat-containing diguanylate cyclase [Dactylosporangium vinaceum]UAB92964.1 GGDEF domain-containing protein [Dactylosporangium vinaceum]
MAVAGVAPTSGLDDGPALLDELLELAEQARLRGDYRTGAAHARRAVAIAGTAAGAADQARALHCLANQLLRLGEHEASIAASRDALVQFERTGDDRGTCLELTALGMAFSELGLFDEALEGLAEAREIALRVGERSLLYWVHNRIGVVHSCMGEHEQADVHLRHALELGDERDIEAGFCILNNLADNATGLVPALRAAGREADAQAALAAALDRAAQGLRLARAADHPYRMAICLDNLGMLLGHAGRYPEAFGAIDEALDLATRHGYRGLQYSAWRHRASVHRLRGEFAEAIRGLTQVLRRAEESGQTPDAMTAHEQLCEAYEQTGDHRLALHHYRRYHLLERQARSDVAAVRARLMTHHFELDNARLEAENARLETELHRVRSRELEEDKQALQRQARQLDRYAHEDHLTGLPNRRWIELRLPELIAMADGDRDEPDLWLAIIDVDRFKGVNDRYGHPLGDEVLRRMAGLLRDGLPGELPGAMVARLGGEEFLLALAGVDARQAAEVCEALRARVAAFDWGRLAAGLHVTASFGLAGHRRDDDHGALLGRADAQLYRAKRNGRNRVEAA